MLRDIEMNFFIITRQKLCGNFRSLEFMLFDSLMIASRCESFQQMSLEYNILEKPFVLDFGISQKTRLIKRQLRSKDRQDKKKASFQYQACIFRVAITFFVTAYCFLAWQSPCFLGHIM